MIITLRATEELKQRLDEICRQKGISASEYLRSSLSFYDDLEQLKYQTAQLENRVKDQAVMLTELLQRLYVLIQLQLDIHNRIRPDIETQKRVDQNIEESKKRYPLPG